MRPLSVRDPMWLEGTKDEVDKFLQNKDLDILGHEDNVRHLLERHPEPHSMPSLLKYIERRNESVPATFVLLQGKIIGLLVIPEEKEGKR